MKTGMLSLGFALVMLAGAGCGGRPFAGSCSILSSGVVVLCTEYHESFVQSLTKAACPDSANQSYSTAECPAANRVGRCEITQVSNGVTLGTIVDYYPPATTASAMSECMRQQNPSEMTTFTAN